MVTVLGIICMFYIRELRVWVLVKSDQVRVAMASNRKTSDLDRDFERHSNALQQLARGE
jgi:cytochrome c biogenesis protein